MAQMSGLLTSLQIWRRLWFKMLYIHQIWVFGELELQLRASETVLLMLDVSKLSKPGEECTHFYLRRWSPSFLLVRVSVSHFQPRESADVSAVSLSCPYSSLSPRTACPVDRDPAGHIISSTYTCPLHTSRNTRMWPNMYGCTVMTCTTDGVVVSSYPNPANYCWLFSPSTWLITAQARDLYINATMSLEIRDISTYLLKAHDSHFSSLLPEARCVCGGQSVQP